MKCLKLWQKAGLLAAIVGGLTLGGLTPNYSSKGLESKEEIEANFLVYTKVLDTVQKA